MNVFETLLGLDMLKAATNELGDSEDDTQLKTAANNLRLAWAQLGVGLFDVSAEVMARAINTLQGMWKPATEPPPERQVVLIECTDPWGNEGEVVFGTYADGEWIPHARFDDHHTVTAWMVIPDLDIEPPESLSEPEQASIPTVALPDPDTLSDEPFEVTYTEGGDDE